MRRPCLPADLNPGTDGTMWGPRSGQDFRANHAHPGIDYAVTHMSVSRAARGGLENGRLAASCGQPACQNLRAAAQLTAATAPTMQTPLCRWVDNWLVGDSMDWGRQWIQAHMQVSIGVCPRLVQSVAVLLRLQGCRPPGTWQPVSLQPLSFHTKPSLTASHMATWEVKSQPRGLPCWARVRLQAAGELGKPLVMEEFGKAAPEARISSVRDPWQEGEGWWGVGMGGGDGCIRAAAHPAHAPPNPPPPSGTTSAHPPATPSRRFDMVQGEVEESLQAGDALRGALFWQVGLRKNATRSKDNATPGGNDSGPCAAAQMNSGLLASLLGLCGAIWLCSLSLPPPFHHILTACLLSRASAVGRSLGRNGVPWPGQQPRPPGELPCQQHQRAKQPRR